MHITTQDMTVCIASLFANGAGLTKILAVDAITVSTK
jgi:hypothetical protein